MTTSLKFFAPARMSEMPPMSIFSMMGHLGLVFGQLATAQDAAKHLGMECLDAAAQDGGVGRDVLYLGAGVAQRLDKGLCAAGREELHTILMQFGQDFLQAVFVEDRNQGGLDRLSC